MAMTWGVDLARRRVWQKVGERWRRARDGWNVVDDSGMIADLTPHGTLRADNKTETSRYTEWEWERFRACTTTVPPPVFFDVVR